MTLFLCTKRFNYVQVNKNRNAFIFNRSLYGELFYTTWWLIINLIKWKVDVSVDKDDWELLRIKSKEKWGHVEYGGQKICIGQNGVCYTDKCLN